MFFQRNYLWCLLQNHLKGNTENELYWLFLFFYSGRLRRINKTVILHFLKKYRFEIMIL